MNKSRIIFLIILLIYWIGLLPYPKAANDLPYSSISFVASQLSWPTAWNSFGGVLGQNQLATLWSWPNNIMYALGAAIGVPFGWLISILGILPILVIGYWGIFYYSKRYLTSELGRSLAGLFYLTNTYIFLVIDGGQLLWALAYSLIPWCLFFFDRYIEQKKSIWLFVLPVILLSFTDFRALFLLGIILTLQMIIYFRQIPARTLLALKKFLVVGFMSGASLLLIHSYWIIPLFFSRSSALPSNLVVSSQSDFLSFISLGHALLMQQPHWYKNMFGELAPIRIEFFINFLWLIPLFIKKYRQYYVLFFFLILGVFLAKGSQPPFGGIYIYLIDHVPGFFLFRDSSKFFTIIALVYAICFGLLIQTIEDWKGYYSRFKKIGISLLIIVVISLAWPVYTGQMTGLLGFKKQIEEFSDLETEISADQSFGRVLWIPQKPPLGFMDRANIAVNGVDLVNLRPFTTGIKGTYETLNFLREASYSGELLAISGIKKIIYSPPHPERTYKPDEIAYYKLFLKQLQERKWVSTSEKNPTILNLLPAQPLFSIPENYYIVVGSDSVYAESTRSANLSLTKNGLIFLEEKRIGSVVSDLLDQKIVLNKKTPLDVGMQIVKRGRFLYPAQYLTSSPDQTGWWSRYSADFLSFRDFLNQKYGIDNTDFDIEGGWAISEGEHQLTLPFSGTSDDVILVRMLESPKSGQMSVSVNGQLLKTLETGQDETNMRWHIVGRSSQQFSSITLATKGDINIINAVAVVPESEVQQINQQIEAHSVNLLTDYSQDRRNSDKAEVAYFKINDDQYRVEISNLKQPSLLVFNQRYDPKWTLDGSQSVPVFSIFNGFIVDKNGSYLVEYSPHRYMWWGGWISMVSLLVGIAGVVYRYYVYKSKV